jgi:hypothetical protein
MNWRLEIVKANNYRLDQVSLDGENLIDYPVTAYYDPVSNTLVPMSKEFLSSRSILSMEEFSQNDEGVILLDYKTNKIGLLIRN